METKCKHEVGTVKSIIATRETGVSGTVICDECGKSFELNHEPAGMVLHNEAGEAWE